MSKKHLDITKWNRKDHFYFFKAFSEPFFGVTVQVDCTIAYKIAKEKGCSFFLYYLHKSLKAVNNIESFKYRIEDDKVAIYERIDPAPTIGRPDGTFGFSNFQFDEDLDTFLNSAKIEINKTLSNSTLIPGGAQNVIYYSALPWLNFTSMSHARDLNRADSVPKISFGKLIEENGKILMSMSVHVNHALMDGYHVGKYVDLFQTYLNEPA